MILALTAAGRDAEAERRLATALRDHPQPGLLHFRYGRALHARGRLPGAIANYQRALEIDRAQPEVRFALGQALFDSGMTTVAIEHLDAACATGVRPDRCGLDLARALVAAGERSRGIAALKTLDPPGIDAAATLYDAGDLALQLGEPRVAERFLMVAILRAPDSSPAHQKLGLSIALQGRHEEALPRLEEAVRLDARDPTARLNLAVEYAHQRRDADARREAGAALEIEPGYERARSFLAELERRR
jgi:tetratricopeptide (TPR) repeat protein